MSNKVLSSPNDMKKILSSPNGVVNKIRSRIELGKVVYEECEHRTLSHEKCHLANTFETQRKMRRELINKVCSARESKGKKK